ncbi:SDR family NAD(P)-dependent oxidoreductase [Alteribacillus sp. YIM 98480]|uniref:SDR family NAD(P)-dependent oxidoreductase n=1 Tax=Alteribacillus sp. YIM 98480 TaxID=2606599 RepID=UPI00131D7E8D|nr:3-oxoacyl-ACP reductase family protein [Alteribacillus sp. YIM 98480]
MKLKGKTALITGAASGIGRGIAEAFAKEGSSLMLNYFGKEKEAVELQKDLTSTYDIDVQIIEADVSNEEQVKHMVDTAVHHFNKIDVLVNSAGILTQKLFKDMDTKTWDQMLQVNLRGPFLCSRYVIPYMIDQQFGRIINISSQLGQIGGVELTHYSAAKAGVIGFTKSLAREVGRDGITVNCIAPGPIETELIEGLDNEWKQNKKKELALPKFGTPEEVAPSAVLLASDPDGNLFTGQTLGPNSGDVML